MMADCDRQIAECPRTPSGIRARGASAPLGRTYRDPRKAVRVIFVLAPSLGPEVTSLFRHFTYLVEEAKATDAALAIDSSFAIQARILQKLAI
jgi:hypothetical protein